MFSKKELKIFYSLPYDPKFAISKDGRKASKQAADTVINQLRH